MGAGRVVRPLVEGARGQGRKCMGDGWRAGKEGKDWAWTAGAGGNSDPGGAEVAWRVSGCTSSKLPRMESYTRAPGSPCVRAPCSRPPSPQTLSMQVLHGADGDVEWLQRDYSLFVVNMFDTGQASRVLQLPSHGLAYLLESMVGFQVRQGTAGGVRGGHRTLLGYLLRSGCDTGLELCGCQTAQTC